MSNHFHLIWQILGENTREKVQLSFLRFTAQQIKFDLEKNHPKVLEHFKVNAKDRMYQFWERNSLSVEITTEHFFYQKLDYIHQNPVKAMLCNSAEDYYFSSAKFYEKGETDFDFLTHYKE
jgi:putative transposase